jgi:hypothetical protein
MFEFKVGEKVERTSKPGVVGTVIGVAELDVLVTWSDHTGGWEQRHRLTRVN